jgi:hypothetical protein
LLGIANVLLALADLFEIGRPAPVGVKQIDLKNQAAAARDGLDHVLERRVGDETTVPIAFAVDFHCREAGWESAARHDMLGPNAYLSVVEVSEIPGAHIDCRDAKAGLARVDAVKIDSLLRRITGDDRSIDRADRNARYPIWHLLRRREHFVHAGLVAAESASALQDESNLLVVGSRARGRILYTHVINDWEQTLLRFWSDDSANAASHRYLRERVG